MTTKIEWTNETWNPIVGCSKVSEGCRNCYAERMAKRLKAIGKPQYQNVVDEKGWTGKTVMPPSIKNPMHTMKKPRMIFVCSMSDLFHETVEESWIDAVMMTIGIAKQHTYQILTKRPVRMFQYFSSRTVPDNVWLGVTAENQAAADERIPHLLTIPAKVRFVSVEPMLGPVDVWQWLGGDRDIKGDHHYNHGLDWIIVGGESGPNARPMHPDWARGLRDQCQAAGVSYFFKQWGEWLPSRYPWYSDDGIDPKGGHTFDDGTQMVRVGKKAAGHLLDGVEWRQMPEVN